MKVLLCEECKGTGQVIVPTSLPTEDYPDWHGEGFVYRECPECKGTGLQLDYCPACGAKLESELVVT